jgi:hypothetical protein
MVGEDSLIRNFRADALANSFMVNQHRGQSWVCSGAMIDYDGYASGLVSTVDIDLKLANAIGGVASCFAIVNELDAALPARLKSSWDT